MKYGRFFLKGIAWGIVILTLLVGLVACLPILLESVRRLEFLQPSLENRPFSIDPDWSPDGQSIVASCAFGTEGSWDFPVSSYEVCIAQADLRSLRSLSPQITASDESLTPTWSPNSQLIAFSSFNLYLASPFDLTVMMLLENCKYPSWSPDSQQIACVQDVQQLAVINLTTDKHKIIYKADGLADQPNRRPNYNILRESYWSKDSRYIYVVEESWVHENKLILNELNRIELETGLSNRVSYLLTQRPSNYSVAPNGQQLLINSFNNLEVINLLDSSKENLLIGNNNGCLVDIFNPSWSEDSQFIAFYADYHDEIGTRLFVLNTNSLDLFELAQPTNWIKPRDEIAWSPDGTKIATSFSETFVLLSVSDKKPANC